MRADRLLQLMLLLQKHGRLTAVFLAKELGVSQRTIYRDVEALALSGVPIYAINGPGGGYALVDSYRTTLTGLTAKEKQAIFLLAMPEALNELTVGHHLKTAVLKLSAAHSNSQHNLPAALQQRIYLDEVGWFQRREPTPHLQTVQTAVWNSQQLMIRYGRSDEAKRQRQLDPYGLVAKAGRWYVVGRTKKGIRVYRLSRVESAELLPELFERPATFDLVTFWRQWVATYEASLPQYPVELLISPNGRPLVRALMGENAVRNLAAATPEADGWRRLPHLFEREDEAEAVLLGLGTAVKVIAPVSLRQKILQTASQIAQEYQS